LSQNNFLLKETLTRITPHTGGANERYFEDTDRIIGKGKVKKKNIQQLRKG
jgi:hypothetical protein